MLQGFDAQLTYDETIYVNMTVCAHSKPANWRNYNKTGSNFYRLDCRDVSGCFGNCIPVEKDFGCLECQCPEGTKIGLV